MKRFAALILALNVFSAWAEAPKEKVQGLYEGTWKSAPVEARLVAMGNGTYKLLARQGAGDKIVRAEVDLKTDKDGAIASDGANKITWSDSELSGNIGDGLLKAKRIERESPTLGKKPPEGAVVLLDGKNYKEMAGRKNEPLPANLEVADDGSIQVPKGGLNSVQNFEGEFDLHVEFKSNLRSAARSQGRGNSGCFLPYGQEIQILDSFGAGTYLGGGCGGLYKYKDPDTMEPIPSMEGSNEGQFNLSSLPPGAWQTYDVEYRMDAGANGNKKGRLTVYHNGIKIHDAVEQRTGKGKIRFQDHGNPVRYRNIWIKTL